MSGLSQELNRAKRRAYTAYMDDLIELGFASTYIPPNELHVDQKESLGQVPEDFHNLRNFLVDFKPSKRDIAIFIVGYLISKGLDQVWFWL